RAEARQEVDQPLLPRDAVLLLEERRHRPGPVRQGHAADLAVGVTANDGLGQGQEVLGPGQARLAQQPGVGGVDEDEGRQRRPPVRGPRQGAEGREQPGRPHAEDLLSAPPRASRRTDASRTSPGSSSVMQRWWPSGQTRRWQGPHGTAFWRWTAWGWYV